MPTASRPPAKGETSPLVSIVIPTFNRERTLRRAVASALDQTYENVEIVVSDNASTDGSLESIQDLATDPRVSVLRSDANRGPIANWQRALEATTGEYVKVVWSDDWMDPDTVEKLVMPLLNDPSLGFAICPSIIHHRDYTTAISIAAPTTLIDFGDLIDSKAGLVSLPDSPGAGLVKRQDALWGVTCSFGTEFPLCHNGAIGPDLLMLYGAFRRGEPGYRVLDTRVHFDAGEDSITMTEARSRLRTCYSLALAYLAIDAGDRRERVVVQRLLTLLHFKRPWTDDADPESLKALRLALTADTRVVDRVLGSADALMKSASYAGNRLTQEARRRWTVRR